MSNWATRTRRTNLIHGLLRFTTKGIIGISRALHSRQLSPIPDSATSLSCRLYYFPDSHSTFICDSKSAAAFTSFVEIPSLLKVSHLTLTARYPQVSLIRYRWLPAPSAPQHHWFRSFCTEFLLSYCKFSVIQHRHEEALTLVSR